MTTIAAPSNTNQVSFLRICSSFFSLRHRMEAHGHNRALARVSSKPCRIVVS